MTEEMRLEKLAEQCAAVIAHPYLREVRIGRIAGKGARYSMRVAFNTVLVVNVPYLFSETDTLNMIKMHRRYVLNRLRPQPVLPAYEEGDVVFLFGKEYKVVRAGDGYMLSGERRIDCGKDVKKYLVGLLYTHGEVFLRDYTRTMAAVCGVKCPAVTLSRAKSYWGCCRRERGGVTISYRLWACLLPERLLRYLVVHELCHVKHPNHSRAFWAAVQKVLPDYKESNKLLGDYAAEDFCTLFGMGW